MRNWLALIAALALGAGLLLAQEPARPYGSALAAPSAQEEPAAPRYDPPQVLATVDAAYPVNSVAFGTVVLEVALDPDGKIEKVTVVRDIPSLTAPAEQAVRQWKFRPARLDGRPVASSLPVAFIFVRPDLWPRLGVPR